MQIQSLDQEASQKEGMVTHSSILAWRIPWTEEPCRLQSYGCEESDMTEATQHACTLIRNYTKFGQNTPMQITKLSDLDFRKQSPQLYLFTKSTFFFQATPCGTWDLTSPIRDQTYAPCSGSTESWTTREVPRNTL